MLFVSQHGSDLRRSGGTPMANREQKTNREKKKPKQAKAPAAPKTSAFSAPPGRSDGSKGGSK
jgi:hypothetical protein